MVNEGDRQESVKFGLLTRAQALVKYTLQITSNEKVFKPEYQRALTDDINNAAKTIFLSAFEANNIWVEDESDIRRRYAKQKEALIACDRLLALMEIAYSVFHLRAKRIKYWGTKTVDVKHRLRAWISSDAKRYGKNRL